MSIYHKITELSISLFSMLTLIFNLLFPNIALAADISRNNALVFNYSENAGISSFAMEKVNASAVKKTDARGKSKENKAGILPIARGNEEKKLNKIVIIGINAKNLSENDDITRVLDETNDKIAAEICLNAGLVDLPCWKDLKAMREKESYNGKQMTGDGGRSRGWYHIQIKLHKVSDGCALDFKCSTEWTVNNLIANGYKTNRFYAISRHNGGGVMAQNYARSVVYNSGKFNK